MFKLQQFTVAATGRAEIPAHDTASQRSALQARLLAGGRPANLKHADDQCLTGLLAMDEALRQWHGPAIDPQAWGLLAAPRTPGRASMASVVQRFSTEGAWGVSPHIIPNCSLHSLAGFLSMTCGLRGPNLGVGGTLFGESAIWLVAASWLTEPLVPGLWLLLSNSDEHTCKAIALAILSERVSDCAEVIVRAIPDRCGFPLFDFSLESFDRVLALDDGIPVRSFWNLPGGFTVEWRNRLAAKCRPAA